MKYYDYNKKNEIEVKESKSLVFLYNNILGRLILKILTSHCIAKIVALFLNSKYSKYKINKFIKNNNICMDDYELQEYKSFNDFFMRKIKPQKRQISNGNIAICDAKLSVYKINKELSLNIKNSIYTIEELIQEKVDGFEDGYAFIYRLAVDDYHHYIFPCAGKIIDSKKIKGILHTVQPIAFKMNKVFTENSREISILDTKDYGKIIYIEVGAMLIGKIANENKLDFEKGEEKGHFEFGGSTIILLFQKDKVSVNDIILNNTKNGVETIVKMGENLE